MKHWIKGIAIVLLGVSLAGCGGDKEDGISAVSTIGMIHDIVSYIGGDHVQSKGLMGPGVDPHLYKATEGDVRLMGQADIIFYNGLHLEAKMSEIIEKMAYRTTVVQVTKQIPESKLQSPPEFDGFHDPHVWFDVSLWLTAAKTVEEALIERFPQFADDFRKNGESYQKTLKELDAWVKSEVAKLPKKQRVLVTAHDAFGYFGNAYGFEVIGLQGISTATEAGTKDVQELANLIVKRKIPAIFVESSVPERNIKAVQASVKAKGWDVAIGGELYADAMGDEGTEEGTYKGMIKHNVSTIVKALSKQ